MRNASLLKESSLCSRAVHVGRQCCRAAVIAYTMVLQDTADERSVHVIKIGNRYVVMDPFKWAGQVTPTVTFDSTFTNALARVLQ